MKRSFLFFLALLVSLFIFSCVSAQEEIRVKCDILTMSVPSENAECFQTDGNTVISQVAVTVSETQPESSEPTDPSAPDPELANAQISNIALHISDYDSSGKMDPEVIVYSFEDFGAVDMRLFDLGTTMTDVINNIAENYATVEEVPDRVPFFPYQTKQRLVNALPVLIEFPSGKGIRIITAFGDSGESVSNANLIYTMQGITNDGQRYVSAVIPVSCSELEGKDIATLDWNSLSPDSWSPSLQTLDSYMQSIVIQ